MTSSVNQKPWGWVLIYSDFIKKRYNTTRASEGYNVGYELGYIKGVLEHVLEAVPESQDKEAYMKGYVSGYVQGMLYTFARRHRDDKRELKFKSSC